MNTWMVNESLITTSSERYLIFIDETGDPYFHNNPDKYSDPSVFPVMTVAAIIIPTVAYRDIVIDGIDEVKQKFWGDKNIYFHSREIRRKDGIYKNLLDETIYSDFKTTINNLLEQTSPVIIASSINKVKLLKKAIAFKQKTGAEYNIGDLYLRNVEYVLERIGHFLGEDTGKIIFETRGRKESKRIQAVLTNAKDNGTFYCKKDRFRNITNEIEFFMKKDNINGLQIVDYITYPFARHAKNNQDTNNQFFKFLNRFIYKGDFGLYGLKEWP